MFFSKNIQATTPKGFLWFGCGGVVIGLILLSLAFLTYYNKENFAKTAKHATGTVINLSETIDNNDSSDPIMNYFPVVNFAVNGHNYTFTSSTGSNPPEYQQGQNIDVIYDPQNPFNADINSGSSKWITVAIFSGLGLLFTVLGILLIVFRNKVKP